MASEKMNIYTLARLANVSISTISRVLNNYPHVAEEKRLRVQAILDKYNYVPNAAARNLVIKNTKTIGIVITDIRHAHYANIAFTIEQAMNEVGYIVILCNTGDSVAEQTEYLKVLTKKQVDGIIIVGSVFSSPEVEDAIRTFLPNKPVIMHNGRITADNVYSVLTEPHIGIKICIDHLAAKGHRRIGFVQDYETWVAESKAASFRKHLRRHGIEVLRDCMVHVPSGIDGGRKAIRSIFDAKRDITALLAGDDLTAIGAIQELQSRGKRIPEDVEVIGYNNSMYSTICKPTLSSVDNKMESVGTLLAHTLIKLLRGEEVPRTQRIKPELIVRESG